MYFVQPLTVVVALADQHAHEVQHEIGNGASRLAPRFSGREPHPINRPPDHQLYAITVRSTEDLKLIGQVLTKYGSSAWINVPTAQGVDSVPLAEFLQKSGLA